MRRFKGLVLLQRYQNRAFSESGSDLETLLAPALIDARLCREDRGMLRLLPADRQISRVPCTAPEYRAVLG